MRKVGADSPPITVRAELNREDLARLISKYNLLAVPVVDEHDRVIGIVTVDDVIDAMIREQTKDISQLGGVEAIDEPYIAKVGAHMSEAINRIEAQEKQEK